MKLILPNELYKESFIRAIDEYQLEGRVEDLLYANLDIKAIEQDFRSFITSELEKSKGKNLPEGYVPQTTFWLVDKDEFIGRVSIRHSLTEKLKKIGGHIGYDIRPSKRMMGYGKKILALALPEAKKLGIYKALVTCDEDNIGSKKIIEENGGTFEGSGLIAGRTSKTLRYWITIS